MMVKGQKGREVNREASGDLGSIAQLVIACFFVLGIHVAIQAQHLDHIGTDRNRLNIRLSGCISPRWLAHRFGRRCPNRMAGSEWITGNTRAGLELETRVGIVLGLAANREPEAVGQANLILHEPAKQGILLRWRVEADSVSRSHAPATHPLPPPPPQPPYNVMAPFRRDMILKIQVKGPAHCGYAQIRASIGIDISLQ